MATLRVKQGELLYISAFDRPVFDLWVNTTDLFSRLHDALHPYGFKVTDLRWERGTGAIDAKLVFHLMNFRLTVRLRADQMEVQSFDVITLAPEAAAEAINRLLAALRGYRANLSFHAHTLSLAFHGELEGQRVRDFLASFVHGAPTELGALNGTGCIFYFGKHDDRLSMAVTLDSSSAVTDGLFLRVFTAWQPVSLTPERIRQIATTEAGRVAEVFGLTMVF